MNWQWNKSSTQRQSEPWNKVIMQRQPYQPQPCRYYLKGCRYGDNCKDIHDVELITQEFGLHRCPNEGCDQYCRGKQCQQCHLRSKGARMLWEPANKANTNNNKFNTNYHTSNYNNPFANSDLNLRPMSDENNSRTDMDIDDTNNNLSTKCANLACHRAVFDETSGYCFPCANIKYTN